MAGRLLTTFAATALAAAVAAGAADAAKAAPRPRFARSVVVTPLSGRVFVTAPGSSRARLRGPRRVPLRSLIDARNGRLAMATAARRGWATFSAEITGGPFTVRQARQARGLTTLQLSRLPAASCGTATAARLHRDRRLKIRVPRHKRRRYHAAASAARIGRFETIGRFQSGVNLGRATWTTTDTCPATTVSDTAGTVSARTRGVVVKEMALHPGFLWIAACAGPGSQPLPAGYCETLLGKELDDGGVIYAAGLWSDTPDADFQMCVATPVHASSCRTWAFTEPALDGLREGLVVCAVKNQGNYTVSWRVDGVPLALQLPPYRARRPSAYQGACQGRVGTAADPDELVGAPLRPSSTSVNPYSLPTAGALQYLSVFVAPSDTAGRETIQGVVYSDDHGTPDALLGTTEPLTITSADTVGDRQLDFTADLPVAAGPLWIGLIASGTPNIVTIRYQPTAVLAYRKDTDPGVPDDPFGPFLQATERISLEVGYAVDPDWP